MAEVNLKEYFARLSTLLAAGSADEVIHHARHILRYYPKNVEIYRFLGRALVLIGRYEEAQAALRRVLSVLPDDYVAHVALGEVYERTNRCEEAIFHLERAIDQNPADSILLDGLRVLLHRCRKPENVKIQLTAGAVARQQQKAGSPERAIETLRSALKTAPDRVDLRLLLAQVLWESKIEEDAAEAALDVLKQLPDCLEANRILAELWLNYDRPSDAQRFVNRIESVQPYLALELVQGAPPDDDAFRVEELDFQQSAHREAVSARPDWLIDLGAAAGSEGFTPEPPPTVEDEWTSWSSAMLSSQAVASTPEASPAAADDLGWLSSFPVRGEQAEASAPPPSVSDADLDNLFGTGGLPPAPEAFESLRYTPPSAPEEEDPFAWMQGAGAQLASEGDSPADADQPEFASFFDEPEAPLPEEPSNPLAWMNQYDQSLLADDSPPGQGAAADPDDPFATQPKPPYEMMAAAANLASDLDWLRTPAPDADSDDDSGRFDAPLDFGAIDEQGVNIEAPPPAAGRRGLTAILSDGNFEWMQKPDGEPSANDDDEDWLNQFKPAEAKPASSTASPGWLTDLDDLPMPDLDFGDLEASQPAPSPAAPAYPPLDAQLPPAPTQDDEDDLFSLFATDASAVGTFDEDSSAAEDAHDKERMWMSENDPNANQPERRDAPEDGFDWLMGAQPETAQPGPGPSDFTFEDDAESWEAAMGFDAPSPTLPPDQLGSLIDDGGEALPMGDDVPDWLREASQSVAQPLADAQADAELGELDWLNDAALADASAITSAALDSGAIDFAAIDEIDLFSTGKLSALPEEPELEVEFSLGDVPALDVPDEDVPDWLKDAAPAALAASEAGPADQEAAMNDWLNALPIESPDAAAEPQASAAVGLPPEAPAPALDEVAADGEEFDWLSVASPADVAAPSEFNLDDLFAEPAEEPAEAMAAMAETPTGEADLDWLSSINDDAIVDTLAEMGQPLPGIVNLLPEDDDSDWLEDSRADAETLAAEGVGGDVLMGGANDWLSDFMPEVPAEQPVALTDGDMDDLFGDMAPALSEEPAVLAQSDLDDLFGDMAPAASEEPAALTQSDIDDLFGDMAPAASEEPAALTQSDIDDLFGDMAPAASEEPAALTQDDIDDLFGDMAPAASEEPAAAPMLQAADDEMFADEALFDEDGLEAEEPANVPEWLNALVPGLDVDTTAHDYVLPDEEFEQAEAPLLPVDNGTASNSAFGWLTAIVDTETAASRPVARFTFSRPPAWARAAAPVQPHSDDDFPDWIADENDDD